MREQSTKLSHIVAQFKVAGQQEAVHSATSSSRSTASISAAKPVARAAKSAHISTATKKISNTARSAAAQTTKNNEWEEF